MALQVTSVLWKQHVEDRPVTADDFQVASSSIDPQQMGESDILVELLYLSVDPYMRGMMRDTKSYDRQPFGPGMPMSSLKGRQGPMQHIALYGSFSTYLRPPATCAALKLTLLLLLLLQLSIRHFCLQSYYRQPFEPGMPLSSRGIVLVTKAGPDVGSGFEEGDVLSGMLPWSSHAVLGRRAQAQLQLVDSRLLGKVPLPSFIGVLGMPGLTAYASLKKIAQPQPGEVAFVSGAAGAVGSTVGQLLKNVYGCTVIGSAGSDEKVSLLKQHGFDAAFNYKASSTADALKGAAPDGIDIYFDNVGGPTLDVVLEAARPHARIVACGAISQYDLPEDKRYGVKNLINVITKRIKLQGFIVSDYAAEMAREFHEEMSQHALTGKVKALQHVTQGLENAGAAFVDMMAGGNAGKAVVQVVQQDPYPVKQQ